MAKKLFIFVVLALSGIHAFTQTAQTSSHPIPFAPAVNYGAGDGPFYLCCADLDGDSDLDIAVTNLHSNDVSILKNIGDGTFSFDNDYDIGHTPAIVCCGDLDNDSHVDLAVGSYGGHYVSVIRNNGDGSFQPKEDYVVFVHLVDIDGQLVASHDGPPMDRRYPTGAWLPGEIVPDDHRFVLDPQLTSGTYQLKVGMYRWPSLERLPVWDSQGVEQPDRVLVLQSIEVH